MVVMPSKFGIQPWDSPHRLRRWARTGSTCGSRERESLQEAIDAVLAYEPDGDDEPPHLPEWLRDRFKAVRNGCIEDHPDGGVVLFARKSASDRDAELDLFADDDDLLSASGREIPLADHTALVERAVERIARRCLPLKLLGPLLRAARWHDVGKLDERFQLVLRQGDEIANELGKPLAKSAFVPASPARWAVIRAAATAFPTASATRCCRSTWSSTTPGCRPRCKPQISSCISSQVTTATRARSHPSSPMTSPRRSPVTMTERSSRSMRRIATACRATSSRLWCPISILAAHSAIWMVGSCLSRSHAPPR